MDTLELMGTFCRVVDAGSFTRAADQLNLSKAVVSKYVRELEQRLDTRLLHRTTRSLSLTESGELYYRRSSDILGQIQELEANLLERSQQVQGQLRVSVPLTFGEMFVAPYLHGFMEQYPALKLDIVLSDRQVSLLDENFDLAVRIGDISDTRLVARKVGDITVKLCAAPGYLAVNGTPRSYRELAGHRLLIDSNGFREEGWPAVESNGKACTIPVSSRLRINSARAMREMLLRGEGISLCPSFAVDDCLKRGSLVALLPDYDFGGAPIHAVYPDSRYVPERVPAFIRFMERIVSSGC